MAADTKGVGGFSLARALEEHVDTSSLKRSCLLGDRYLFEVKGWLEANSGRFQSAHLLESLGTAVFNGHEEITKTLLEHFNPADLEERLSDGFTLLSSAVYKGRGKIVEMLISAGAQVNTPHLKNGLLPIHYSFKSCKQPILAQLLRAGADINARCDVGRTAVHYAAAEGAGRWLATLNENEAEIDLTDHAGVRPISLALENLNDECVELLLSWGALHNDLNEPVQRAVDRILAMDWEKLPPDLAQDASDCEDVEGFDLDWYILRAQRRGANCIESLIGAGWTVADDLQAGVEAVQALFQEE